MPFEDHHITTKKQKLIDPVGLFVFVVIEEYFTSEGACHLVFSAWAYLLLLVAGGVFSPAGRLFLACT